MALNVGELYASLDLRDRMTPGLRNAVRAIRESERRLGRSFESIGTSMTRMMAKAGAAALAISVLGGAATVGAQGVLALAAALAPAVGIVATLPALAFSAAAALGVLLVAFNGIGDAFSAALGDDAQEFNEALEGLSPATRRAAIELRTLKPAFDNLRATVQEAFFRPLTGEISALGKALAGPLTQGMAAVAGQMGVAARQVTSFAREAASVRAVQDGFAALADSIAGLTPAIKPLLRGFRDLGVVGTRFWADLSPQIAAAATRFGQYLQHAAESGKAHRWLTDAVQVFKQLGSILKDIWQIFGGIFDAIETSGSSALGVIGSLLDKANQWVNSTQGQQQLVAIFTALGKVGDALGPVFTALARAVAAIAPHVANIATALGPGLAAAIDAIGRALVAAAPGLTAFAQALSESLTDPAVQQAIVDIGSGLGNFFAILAVLTPSFLQLLAVLAKFAPIALPLIGLAVTIGKIGKLMWALSPIFGLLGQGIVALGIRFGLLSAGAAMSAGNVARALFAMAAQGIAALGRLAFSLAITAGQFVARAAVMAATMAATAARVVASWTVMAVQSMARAAMMAASWVIAMGPVGWVIAAVVGLVALIITNWDKVVAVTKRLWAAVSQWVQNRVRDVLRYVGYLAGLPGRVAAWFTNLKNRAIAALARLAVRVYAIGRNIVTGLRNGVAGAWNAFVGWLGRLVGGLINTVKSWLGIGSPSRVFAGIGKNTMMGLDQGMRAASKQVLGTASGIARQLTGQFSPAAIDLGGPGVGPGGARGPGAVINVTNMYPVAEPTSITVNRGLQYAGMLGVI